mgnify:CR=1 FL=1
MSDPYRIPPPPAAAPTPEPGWYALRGLLRVVRATLRFLAGVVSAAWTGRTEVAHWTRLVVLWLLFPATLAVYGLRRAGGKYDEPRTVDPCTGTAVERDLPEMVVRAVVDSVDADEVWFAVATMILCFTWLMVGIYFAIRCFGGNA